MKDANCTKLLDFTRGATAQETGHKVWLTITVHCTEGMDETTRTDGSLMLMKEILTPQAIDLILCDLMPAKETVN